MQLDRQTTIDEIAAVGLRESAKFGRDMKTRIRFSPTLLIAMLALGLVIGWWASLGLDTVGTRTETEAATVDSYGGLSRGAASELSIVPKPAVTKPLVARSTDALLESLRARLEAANMVPREALLTFRNAEARDRFMQETAGRGLEILDTIPQLNSARVRYGRLGTSAMRLPKIPVITRMSRAISG